MRSRAVLLVLLLAQNGEAVSVRSSHKVTPIEKVTELLTKMDAAIVAEGKEEAAQYDKYACFCKEQADNKLYAIETSDKKMTELTNLIADLGAAIIILNRKVVALGVKIAGYVRDIGTKTDARKIEFDKYVLDDKDVSDAIDSCERAIAALKESRGKLEGNVDIAEAALVQVKGVALIALGLVSSSNSGVTEKQWKTLTQLANSQPGTNPPASPGSAYDYKFNSQEIVALIEDLRLTFTKEKNRLDEEEFQSKTLFDKAVLAMENEKQFAEADKVEKTKIAAFKGEQKDTAAEELRLETDMKAADESFLGVLQTSCEDKAKLFDKRSTTRSEELTAISDCQEELKTGKVAENWKANRKLNGFAQTASAKAAPSFLQLRGAASRDAHGESMAVQMQRKVVSLLTGSAGRLGSSLLRVAALKVAAGAAEDHFVKVRSIINDIISTLEAQAKAEATTKSFCDKAMLSAVTDRDAEQAKKEDFDAQIAVKEADKVELEEDIAQLSQEIAELAKALVEATELRATEKEDNEKIIEEAGDGKVAVGAGLKILKDFYTGQGMDMDPQVFAQVSYVPFKAADSDRDGETVASLAPEGVFDDEYKGDQQRSRGVIGMLEVMISDFDRTVITVTQDEADAVKAFNAYEKKTKFDIDAKEKDKTLKEGLVQDIIVDLVTLRDSLKTARDAHAKALEELEKLGPKCVDGEETYAERIEKRQQEIEALKEAHSALENWQN